MSRSIARLEPKLMPSRALFYFLRRGVHDLAELEYLPLQERRAVCKNLQAALKELEVRGEQLSLPTAG